MATPPADAGPATARTCSVKGWSVFGPGYHKGELYSPAKVRRIAENFRRLYPRLVPTAKVGHSGDQEVADRMKQSLGFASLGDVTAVRVGPGGELVLDVDNVPASLGAAINGGRFRAGSIEVLPGLLDPATNETVDGPVLTGVAFLGEEQPAVKGFAPPRATWPDERPVPPDAEPAAWLAAMADALKTYAARSGPPRRRTVRFGGREYAAQTLCYSEVIPVRDELNKRLMAAGCDPQKYSMFADDQLAPVVDDMERLKGGTMGDLSITHKDGQQFGVGDGSGNQAGQRAALAHKDGDPRDEHGNGLYADMPADAPPYAKAMYAAFAQKFSGYDKRFGALEAAREDAQKATAAAQMSAFSQQVDAVLDRNRKKLTAAERAAKQKSGLEVLTAKHFASDADRTKAFSDWAGSVDALPENPLFKDTVADNPGATAGELTPLQRAMLDSETTRRHAPGVRARLLAPAAAK